METVKDEQWNDRWVSLRGLRVLNKSSIREGYNRNLYTKVFEGALKDAMEESDTVTWRGLKTEVLVCPVMIHEHKGGVPCKPHMRCRISTGGYLDSEPVLDIPMELFEGLEIRPDRTTTESTPHLTLVSDNE